MSGECSAWASKATGIARITRQKGRLGRLVIRGHEWLRLGSEGYTEVVGSKRAGAACVVFDC